MKARPNERAADLEKITINLGYVDLGHVDLLVREGERGVCRVICYSPDHSLTLSRMTPDQIEPVVAAWLKQMKERHVDGGKLLAGARKLIAKYAAEPEPQPPQDGNDRT